MDDDTDSAMALMWHDACGRKLERISPSERDHVWMGAVKKSVLLILHIISILQVTSRGGIVSPGRNSICRVWEV